MNQLKLVKMQGEHLKIVIKSNQIVDVCRLRILGNSRPSAMHF